MGHPRHLQLVSTRPGPASCPDPSPGSRYRLYLSGRHGPATVIRVYDRVSMRVRLEWRGEFARRLLADADLPLDALADGSHACDKALMQSLALAAASLRLQSEQARRPLEDRSGSRGPRLARSSAEPADRRASGLHHGVADLLFRHADQHLAEHEVVCLSLLRYPCLAPEHVEKALDDLVTWDVVRRIRIEADTVFYDTDTRPHVHVYDESTRQLRDAPEDAVLRTVTST